MALASDGVVPLWVKRIVLRASSMGALGKGRALLARRQMTDSVPFSGPMAKGGKNVGIPECLRPECGVA